MKKALLAASAAVVLAACVSKNTEKSEKIGMANPASEFCAKQGGRLEPKKDTQGNEYALCHLPDGTVVEEWEYFRSKNGGQ